MFYFKDILSRLGFLLFSTICSGLIIYNFLDEAVIFLINPVIASKSGVDHFIYTKPMEAFTSVLWSWLLLLLLFIVPYFFWLLYDFFKPGLYQQELVKIERVYSIIFVGGYFFLILSSNLLFPIIWAFFTRWGEGRFPFDLELSILYYISFIRDLVFVFFLFYIINIILFLYLVSKKVGFIVRVRRFLYCLFIILATIFSAPDLISQITFFFLLCLFLETTIFHKMYLCLLKRQCIKSSQYRKG